ncbi:RimJ/RimL family protein N-acetyltransferase [Chitinophaga terrae (ex Kim and Jung 2007)]|uniref:GNAT family N-acetyltransferase n=1 Tax=Chitinophaga terrae (ex Kim and Jung 2007) TaxID=408074 RepID=UPI0027845DE5|nr:GNAT family protein [Chitinophaga terrae (ex Kim and Jung 2007)]MDQ0110486.1 RimJ/RimL family protein N-acetyltransferase [Chitinophaga terrae (ex Kim and Jung 2007)]
MNLSIQSSRLLIRDFSKNDWEALHHLYMMPETVKYNPSGYPESESATKKLVHKWSEQQELASRDEYTGAVIDKATGGFVGVISLDLGDAKYRKAEVWYKLLPEYWGKGYATEAVTSVLAFGFGELKLHRIECGCSVHNLGSYRVMEKVGMTREGIKRKVLPLDDGWHDAYVYGILEGEFVGIGK